MRTLELSAALTAVGLSGSPLLAQCAAGSLRGSDSVDLDYFGWAVDVDGDRMIVGASSDDDLGGGSGAAYVFLRTPTGWVEERKLLPSDGEAGDAFGSAVAISDTRAVVGAPHHTAPPQGGAVYVFELQGSAWVQTARLDVPSLDWNSLGTSVDIDGTIVAAGAPYDSTIGVISGAVYVFEESGGVWTQTARFIPSDVSNYDAFGTDVAVSGTRLLASSPSHTLSLPHAGAAWLYERGPSGWFQRAMLRADPAQGESRFGHAVALDGDRAIVAAPHQNDSLANTGAAFVFERQGGNWNQTAELVAGDPSLGADFGWSVALSGDEALVGSRHAHTADLTSGAGYWFRHDGSEWSQEARLVSLGANSLGFSAALDGATAAMGHTGPSRLYLFEVPAFAHPYCPCAAAGSCANSDPSGGCAHSENYGGVLGACGSASVAADDLLLSASLLPDSSIALLFAGDQRAGGGLGVHFGDGLLCVAGGIRRLGTLHASDAGDAQWGPGLNAFGGWSAGDVRHFQVWFRDPSGPCGSGFNLSNAVELRLAP